jgi:hypothetical protein
MRFSTSDQQPPRSSKLRPSPLSRSQRYTGKNPWLRYTVRAVAGPSGNIGSFEDLAMPYFARLYNLACWLTRDQAEADVIEGFTEEL